MQRPVTIDTGGPDDVFVGALVVWLHIPSGGYGYTLPIDATVDRITPKSRVTIRLQRQDGSELRRNVHAARLRWRERGSP